MAQSSEDTVIWKTAQWEANKHLQLNEPEYVGSGATTALWYSSGPCEKTDDKSCHNVYDLDLSPTATASLVEYLARSVFLSHEQYWSPESVCQSVDHSPQTTVCRYILALVGSTETTVIERDNEEHKSGYDTEQGEAETEWKIKIKTPNPTVPHL